jgi:hypothetical protein
MGSELVRLVAGGYVDIVKGRIVRLNGSLPTDLILVNAIQTISHSQKAKGWVAKPRKEIVEVYLRQLEKRRVLRCESRKALGLFRVTDWFVVDTSRRAAVRRRIDAITTRTGFVGMEDRALAGLAYATGLGDTLYAGRGGRQQRERLKDIARPRKTGRVLRGRNSERTPVDASLDAARGAAIAAAVEATVELAVEAAVNAAIDVTIDAGHDGGGGHGGGGHGGH